MSLRFAVRPLNALALSLAVVACEAGNSGGDVDAGVDAGDPAPPDFCTVGPKLTYAPLEKSVDAFPDDYWTMDDTETATGVRVSMIANDNLTIPSATNNFASVYADISRLDGFGTTAAGFFRVEKALADAVTATDKAGTSGHPILFARIDGADAELVEFDVLQQAESGSDESVTLVIAPARPLVPKARYVLALTREALAADGSGCVVPSDTMKSLLDGTATDPALARLAGRYTEAIAKLKAAGAILGATSLSAAVVFTTEHTTEGATAVANHIRGRTFSVSSRSCTVDGSAKLCEFEFAAGDYRKNGYFDENDIKVQKTYTLKASAWMPAAEHTQPWKTIVAGHGLGGDRSQGGYIASGSLEAGYAVVAIDAPKHGEHPDKPTVAQLGSAEFLGAGLSGFSVRLDARKLRDNLATAAYDKLQLLEVLKDGIDLDEDGVADLSADSLVYLGVSLGGIMAPQFLAYAPEVQVATPIVPGARMTDILRDSENFQQVVAQVRPRGMTDGMFARMLPVFQTVVERGDPATYLPHVLKDRFEGFDAQAPQLLVQMVKDDAIVANSATKFYARAAGIPLLGEEIVPIPFIQRLTTFPVSNNVSAKVTGGLYQFDILEDGSPAEHSNLFSDRVSTVQVATFIDGWFADGEASIIDSYVELGVK